MRCKKEQQFKVELSNTNRNSNNESERNTNNAVVASASSLQRRRQREVVSYLPSREREEYKDARTKIISQMYNNTFLKVQLYSNCSTLIQRYRRASEYSPREGQCLTSNLNASHAFRGQFYRDSWSYSHRNVYCCS